MAGEYSEITAGNPPDTAVMLEHILTDLHDALAELHRQGKIQARHDALLEEFRPLLDTYRSPVASYLTARRKARNG